ncbi:MAG TPA: S8 family serine peptidase [Solirubrobacteraceae bacterium]|nr:S8 family serine peptidase [Solirubrobacteraceae bacterium]
MSALLASAALATVVAFGLHQWQIPSVRTASASGAAAADGSSAPLDPRIASLSAHHPNQTVSTIIQFKATVSPDRARWDVSRVQGHVFGELHIINALAVKLTAGQARRLAANPDVHSVSLNTVVKSQSLLPIASNLTSNLQNTYDQTLDVLPAWRAGYTGAGVGVAVIDTGIDGDLPDFQSRTGSGSRVVEAAVTDPNATTPNDLYGHGTDVAGIIAGDSLNRSPSDPLYGQYMGVAPDANLISIKASDDQGNSTVLDVIYALQFAVDHQSDYNIRVINMSLDSTTPQSYTTDPLDAAAESAWMHGIVVVAAAGNRGTAPDAVQYSPANDPYVITVGAVDEQGQTNPANDVIASWSSLGTTQDGFQKPDVYAPGAHITSVLAPNSAFQSMCPTCVIGGAYIKTGGTSMAAPMISGLVADMLQYHPSWTPDQVKGALTTPWVSDNSSIQIPDAMKLAFLYSPQLADQGLTPNSLIMDSQGDINYGAASWTRSTWSQATGTSAADFARSTWSCTCSTDGSGTAVEESRSTWSTYWGN